MNINRVQIPQSKVSRFVLVFSRDLKFCILLTLKKFLFKFIIIMRVRYQNEKFRMFLIRLLITFPVEWDLE